MFVVLPGTSDLHRAAVADMGSKRTVATLCGLHEVFAVGSVRNSTRPRVFTASPVQAITSGELKLCAACEQQKVSH
jgi:hypothetical protein